MKLLTPILFLLLLKMLQPDLICDIGAMDAREALLFRKVVPQSAIVVFEANPGNVELMKRKGILSKKGISIKHNVVWHKNEKVNFYVEKTMVDTDIRRGISSTRKRREGSLGSIEISVSGVRLDSFVNNIRRVPNKIALWIDAEGAAYEVISGFEEIRNQVKIVHLEAETKEVWLGQKLQPEIEKLMGKMGFVLLAPRVNAVQPDLQQDLIFIDKQTLQRQLTKVKFATVISFVITLLINYARPIWNKLF
jgi:FkbM family methyltransferase